MPGPLCSICARPAMRKEIDALIAAKEANTRIAARFGISEATVRRHRAHIPPPPLDLDAVGSDLLRRGLRVLDRAEASGSIPEAVAALSACAGLIATVERTPNHD